jgi:hypothetical protein
LDPFSEFKLLIRHFEALYYKPECLGFDSRYHCFFFVFFNLPNPSSRILALGSTQPLTEIVPGIFLWAKGWLALKTDNLTSTCGRIV